MTKLVLRPLTLADEAEATAAHAELARDDFRFLLVEFEGRPWSEVVERFAEVERGENLDPDWVPSAFLVADVEGDMVGRVSIRYEPDEALVARWGGHIGYGVRPQFRGHGFATEILRQALAVLVSRGVTRALVTCDDVNVASAATIERCGGVLQGIVEGQGLHKRRYWVPTS